MKGGRGTRRGSVLLVKELAALLREYALVHGDNKVGYMKKAHPLLERFVDDVATLVIGEMKQQMDALFKEWKSKQIR